jgi:hypothetical protein
MDLPRAATGVGFLSASPRGSLNRDCIMETTLGLDEQDAEKPKNTENTRSFGRGSESAFRVHDRLQSRDQREWSKACC